MARAPSLAAPTLSPFGGSGAGFGAFSIVDPGREAYIAFLKVENAWQNGQTTDTAYLAAMRTYANALPEGSSNRINTEQRILETTYRVERNVLVDKIDNGDRDLAELLDFDRQRMAGLDPNSETYRDRRNLYQQTQRQIFAEAEDAIGQRYQDGLLTTAQLQAWYREQASVYADNGDLHDALDKRIHDLDSRVLDERDAQAINDYNDGRLTDDEFLVYARAARARYSSGTSQAREWDGRVDTASKARVENDLLYRYGLSQRYAELQQFVQSNTGSNARTSTSTSTRIVLGADGQWKTVTSSSTSAVKPSASEVAAHQRLQVQIADAKRQMAEVAAQLGSAPGGGGWVATDSMIRYYEGRQAGLSRGSGDWYAMQEKIDSLQERQHAETVLSGQGIRITYPGLGRGSGGAAAPTATTGAGGAGAAASSRSGDVGVDQFMAALARVESGGRYDARNKSSGAYGKYQIMPANWPSWAQRYLGNANAAQTPENQEAVARGRIAEMYSHLGSWDAVAYKWLTGASGSVAKNPALWSAAGRSYVTNVMGGLGRSPAQAAPGATTTPSTGSGVSASPAAGSTQGKVGGLSQIVAIRPQTRTTAERFVTKASSFPTNLDGQAFERLYSAYERAFNSGAESFVDTSSGTPIAYFVGANPGDRIDRMRQLDDLRIQYYQTRAVAYEGTPTEITAHNQLNEAVQDLAAHEYRILDTPNAPGKGKTTSLTTSPLAGGLRILDKTKASIALEIAAAKTAYDRGDVAAAYAHMQLAGSYLDASVTSSGPTKGERIDALAQIAGATSSTEQMIARIMTAFGGISPDEALGTEGGGKFSKDLERLRNAGAELAESLSSGDELLAGIQQQVKVDSRGNVVLDRFGQVQLGEGWARFITPSGKVEIKRVPPSGVDPRTGEVTRAPEGKYVKVVTKVGNSVEDAYAAWAVGNVGYIRGADGVNRALQGKIVTVVVNGQERTLFEDPLNPGHWSSAPVVFNQPTGFKAVADGKGNTIYQFSAPASSREQAGVTYALQFDASTGTYIIVGNRPGGLFQQPIEAQPVGGAGDANVLDLLNAAGFTRDTRTAAGAGGFTDVTTPIFGLTPDEYQRWLNPVLGTGNRPLIPLNRSGSPDDRDEANHLWISSLNRSGSPDDRDEAFRIKTAALNRSGSPDERGIPAASPDPLARKEVARPGIIPGGITLPAIKLSPNMPLVDTREQLQAEKQITREVRAAPTAKRTVTRRRVAVQQPAAKSPVPIRQPFTAAKLRTLETI